MLKLDLTEIESVLRYSFKRSGLLLEALTHRSYTAEHAEAEQKDNERLEFIGDAVLGFVVAEYLHQAPKQYPEGQMSKMRAAIVCEATLAEAARSLNLGQYLYLGKGEAASGGRDKDSNLSNAMEAVFAAIYLDGGLEAVKLAVFRIMRPYIQLAIEGQLQNDYKTALLELAQSLADMPSIEFHIIDEAGPIHDRMFTAEVRLGGQSLGRGRGKSKKQAEQQAAKATLLKLKAESAE